MPASRASRYALADCVLLGRSEHFSRHHLDADLLDAVARQVQVVFEHTQQDASDRRGFQRGTVDALRDLARSVIVENDRAILRHGSVTIVVLCHGCHDDLRPASRILPENQLDAVAADPEPVAHHPRPGHGRGLERPVGARCVHVLLGECRGNPALSMENRLELVRSLSKLRGTILSGKTDGQGLTVDLVDAKLGDPGVQQSQIDGLRRTIRIDDDPIGMLREPIPAGGCDQVAIDRPDQLVGFRRLRHAVEHRLVDHRPRPRPVELKQARRAASRATGGGVGSTWGW